MLTAPSGKLRKVLHYGRLLSSLVKMLVQKTSNRGWCLPGVVWLNAGVELNKLQLELADLPASVGSVRPDGPGRSSEGHDLNLHKCMPGVGVTQVHILRIPRKGRWWVGLR